PVAGLLALEGVVIQGSVAGHMLFVQGADAIEQVVARDLPMLAGDVVNGRTQVLVIRAAGIAPHPIIDDASAAIDPGPILHLVGNPRGALGPTIGPVLSDEDMVVLEAAGG